MGWRGSEFERSLLVATSMSGVGATHEMIATRGISFRTDGRRDSAIPGISVPLRRRIPRISETRSGVKGHNRGSSKWATAKAK